MVTTQPTDQPTQGEHEALIEGLPPMVWHQRQAKRSFVYMAFTPLMWLGLLIFIDLLAGIFPSTSPDSWFVFVTWGAVGLIYTLTVTFAGRTEANAIRESDDQQNLWMARWASIGGTVFTMVNIAMIVAIFIGDDAGNRPIA